MTDRRLLRSNGRVADVTLRGEVDADRFVTPVAMRVTQPVAALMGPAQDGRRKRERELVLHEVFEALEDRDGWVFGYAARDGFVGYMRRDHLAEVAIRPTHVVSVRQSYLTPEPVLKNAADMLPISLGSAFEVASVSEDGRWSEVVTQTGLAWVPTGHLRPVDQIEDDPVTVAERFLGTPYHWGGNSGFGIDCSGLVQAGLLACGIDCPGDSDLQEAALGDTLADDAPLRRGDLLFWKGHVAWVAGDTLLLHANSHHMAVAYEPADAAIARIARQGDGPVTRRARIKT